MSKKRKNYRKNLKAINEQRMTFRGCFERFGTKPGWEGREEKTILLLGVIRADTGELATEHLWLNYTKGFERLGELTPGQWVEFDARVKSYKKGYRGHREDVIYSAYYKPPSKDYKLSHPTKIKKLD